MQQRTILIGKARPAWLSGLLVFAFFLFAGVSSVSAQNWVNGDEATMRSKSEVVKLQQELAALSVGTLEYEQKSRRISMYNHLVSNLKATPSDVGLALTLAVRSAYAPSLSTDPALRPVKEEPEKAQMDATTLLSN